MIDCKLGNNSGTEYKIEHLKGAQPYHAKQFPILKIYKETLKTEVNTLEIIGVLRHKTNFEWAAHIFIIPKKWKSLFYL